MTEVDKYAKGATKPGGYAAQGYYKDGSGATVVVAQPVASTSEPADTAYLATRPPWTCSVCKVTCTSQGTLLGHAGGVEHRRRVSNKMPVALTMPVVSSCTQWIVKNPQPCTQQEAAPVRNTSVAVLHMAFSVIERCCCGCGAQREVSPVSHPTSRLDACHTLQARAAAKEEKGSEAAQQSQAETVTDTVSAAIVTAMKRTADSNNEEPMVTVKKQKKSRLQADTKQAANGQDEARLSNGDSADIAAAPTTQKLETIKWKKMALQALKGSRDNCMKLSKLQKQLQIAANVSDVQSADADTLIASRLKGSSQFVRKGKMVSLGSTASS